MRWLLLVLLAAAALADPLDPPSSLTGEPKDLWLKHVTVQGEDAFPPVAYRLSGKYAVTSGHGGFGSAWLWAVWKRTERGWQPVDNVVILGESHPFPEPGDLPKVPPAILRELLNAPRTYY